MKLRWLVIGLIAAIGAQASPSPFFVANQGQWDAPFAFKMEGAGAIYYVTSKGMTIDYRKYEEPSNSGPSHGTSHNLRLWDGNTAANDVVPPVNVRGHVLKLDFVNANPTPEILGEDKLSSYSNYFIGRDSCNWRGHVPHYQKVMMKAVWPGIDVELVAKPEGVETVYHVAPYADPSQIQIEVEGLDAPLSVDATDHLLFETSLGTIKEQAPFAYQIEGSKQNQVAAQYQVLSASRYALSVTNHDPQKALVIDPLLYGSYWGGFGPDEAEDVNVGPDSTVVVCGTTASNGFPTTPGAYQEHFDPHGGEQGFVSKFGPDGNSLRFSTYVAATGGSVSPRETACIDAGIWVAGQTRSPNFPTTPDAFQGEFQGGTLDGIFLCLSSDGSQLLYSTFLGGSGNENQFMLKQGIEGTLLLGGETSSSDFPLIGNPLFPNKDPNSSDGYFVVFDEPSLTVVYSTFIAGNGNDGVYDVVDLGNGEVWIACGYTYSTNLPVTPMAAQSSNQGQADGYVMQWNYLTNEINYASYWGTSDWDGISGIAVEDSQRIVVAGGTYSPNFPVTPGAFDTVKDGIYWAGVVSIVDLQQGLIAATYIEGSDYHDYLTQGPNIGPNGITVAGEANSYDFPVTPGAYDTLFNGNGEPSWNGGDVFVSRFSLDLSTLEYSTFIGGSGIEQWVYGADFVNHDRIWLIGNTGSGDLPVTSNAVQPQPGGVGDGFIFEFEIPTITSAQNPFILPPSSFSLSVYPNPFNPSTTISFSLPQREHTLFAVFNLLGRQVRSEDWGLLEAGEHHRNFEASGLPSGVYVMRLQAGAQVKSGKMVVVR